MMKGTPTLFALFLLSALTSSHLPSSATAFVVDIEGNPILNGGSYYILPVFRGMGGGVELTQTGEDTCPLTVAQSRSEVSNGLPIIISTPFRILYINGRLPLELSFEVVPICSPAPSPKWTIVKDQPEEWSVKLTADEQDDEQKGWFHIEEYQLNYKLVFCSLSTDVCEDVGIHIEDNGTRRLVLTKNNPFIVQFKKAGTSSFAA